MVAKAKKMSGHTLLKITDAVAPGVMIAQAIGRWGNFCNGEAYGVPTSLPWRMCSDKFVYRLYNLDLINEETAIEMLNGTLGVHPTFLYESLWNLLGFILINIFYKKKRFDGQILLMYVTWYGFGRMFIELLRTDSLTNGSNIRVSSLIGLLSVIVGGTLLLYLFVKNKGNRTFAVSAVSAEQTVTEDTHFEDGAEKAESENKKEEAESNEPPQDKDLKESENTNIQDNEEKDDGKLD